MSAWRVKLCVSGSTSRIIATAPPSAGGERGRGDLMRSIGAMGVCAALDGERSSRAGPSAKRERAHAAAAFAQWRRVFG